MNERQHKKHYSKLEKARNTLQQKQLPPRTPLGDRNTNPTSKGTPLTPLKRTSASRTPWGGPPVDPVGKSPLSSDPFASRRSLADLAKTRSPPFFVSTLCLRFYMLFYVFATQSLVSLFSTRLPAHSPLSHSLSTEHHHIRRASFTVHSTLRARAARRDGARFAER